MLDKKRRILSILIALAMMITYMPALAFAADEEVSTAGVTYGDWGAWSEWQDAAVSGSDTRQVETRNVVDSYTMSSVCYTDPSSKNQRGYWPSANQSYQLRRNTVETWPKAWVDSARWVLGAGSFYDSPDNDNCDGLIHDGTAYVAVHGQGHDYVPFFIIGTNYKTQYRYRDRSVADQPTNNTPSQTDPGSVISDSTVSDAYFSDVSYTGKGVRPGVTIVVNGYTLVEGVDYTVICRNNKKIGRATVIITGCGRYSGTITRTFRIVPKGCSLKSCKSKKGSGQCTVSWKKGPKGCSGYKVRYSTDPNFSSCKTKTIKGRNKTSCTLKKLTKGKTYYVQVCVYKTVKKTRYCSGWSKCKIVKVEKAKKKSKKIKKYKVGKIEGVQSYVVNGQRYDGSNYDSDLVWEPVKKADKYEVYKSDSINGKYKKYKTTKGNRIAINNPSGLECYKVRAVRGKNKGPFSGVAVAYGFSTTIESVTRVSKGGCVMKIRVDNTSGNSRDMTFHKHEHYEYLDCIVNRFDDFTGAVMSSDGYLCDSNGNRVSTKTIKAGTSDDVYLYFYKNDVKKYYDYANSPTGGYEFAISQVFNIVDGNQTKEFDGYSWIRFGHGMTYNDIEFLEGLIC